MEDFRRSSTLFSEYLVANISLRRLDIRRKKIARQMSFQGPSKHNVKAGRSHTIHINACHYRVLSGIKIKDYVGAAPNCLALPC
jgi:hypothetical protein